MSFGRENDYISPLGSKLKCMSLFQEQTTLIDFEKPSHAITLPPTAITLMSKVQVKKVFPKKSTMSLDGKVSLKFLLK